MGLIMGLFFLGDKFDDVGFETYVIPLLGTVRLARIVEEFADLLGNIKFDVALHLGSFNLLDRHRGPLADGPSGLAALVAVAVERSASCHFALDQRLSVRMVQNHDLVGFGLRCLHAIPLLLLACRKSALPYRHIWMG